MGLLWVAIIQFFSGLQKTSKTEHFATKIFYIAEIFYITNFQMTKNNHGKEAFPAPSPHQTSKIENFAVIVKR